MDEATDRARHQGRDAGYADDRQVRDCAYGHADVALRRAWLEGFSQGRMRRRKKVGLTPAGVDPNRD